MFSKFAFDTFSRYSITLQKLHFVPPMTWNPEKRKFEMDPNPNKVRWILSNLNVVVTFIILPIYILTTHSAKLNPSQIVYLLLEFLTAAHAVPLFVMAVTAGKEYSHAMNTFIQLEQYLAENQPISKPRRYPIWYRDRHGLMFTIVALTFLSFIITAPIVLALTGLDSLNGLNYYA
ncbi:hypothetical protein Fcan01_19040 [Folsomia candida]|uniref:Uncharacterized protein n=1 Tax=Folsomia candida TaxID=158441 RepID=A0A226DMM2_FOLCA|nr:hypothetical protein Fcan01_19040 [Folsomia candida]